MDDRFDCFAVFAEMRTGSNLLEANLNALEGVTCHGEAFNPHFVGYPNRESLLGVTLADRDGDPLRLLNVIRDATPEGLDGFRYFHDHDPRVFAAILDDPRCAKIVLTRNPLDSYVSWKIAQATGQWKLTNVERRKTAKPRFDADEFTRHLERLQAFQLTLLHALQTRGQTAFHIAYEDLRDVDVLNGLARWLGVEARLDAVDRKLKPQNPGAPDSKVDNPGDMLAALARLDRFDLGRTPNFEPRRGPAVPGYLAAATTPLLFMPVRSGPEAAVRRWLARLDGVDEDVLPSGFTQKTLRRWKRERPGHRSFTVIRHPVLRAHDAFCAKILGTGPGAFLQVRRVLRRAHALPIPKDAPDQGWTLDAHRRAFIAFLGFVRANLGGQTAVRVDAHWASQVQCLQGMADHTLPDLIVREDEMAGQLAALAARFGREAPPAPESDPPHRPFALDEFYDTEVEQAARDAYGRDYVMFGFDDWN